MTFLTNLKACDKLLGQLTNIADELKDDWKTVHGLLVRATVLKETVSSYLAAEMSWKSSSYTVKEAVAILKKCLQDIIDFSSQFESKIPDNDCPCACAALGISVSAFSRVAFRKHHAAQIAALDSRLNSCSIEFDKDRRRNEVIQDFKDTFENAVVRSLAQLSEEKTDSEENRAIIQSVERDIMENDVTCMNEIMSVLNHRAIQDIVEIKQWREYADDIMDVATKRHGEVFLSQLDRLKFSSCFAAQTLAIINENHLNVREIQLSNCFLDQGAFGHVNLAELRNNTVVAVKRIYQSDKDIDSKCFEAIQHEICLMSRVQGDPHIAQVFGFYEDCFSLNIVLEYPPLGSLWDIIKDRTSFPTISLEILLAWLSDILCAIRFIHEKGRAYDSNIL